MGTLATRIGGAFGLLSVLVLIPALLVGSPDQPRTAADASQYYEGGPAFVTSNGVLPLLHILFGLVFVGALTSMLIRATGPRAEIYIAVVGGALFLTLSAASFATNVVYPAAIVRFGGVKLEFTQPLLMLSAWLSHYAQIGVAAMILSSSISIWRTGVLPKWASAGAVLGILPLFHTWIPVLATISALLWIALIGLVMLVAAKQTSPAAVEARGADDAPGVFD